jgi:hypothetical protein
MADCFLCEDFVGDETGDGGVKGRRIGNRDICEQCLSELKYWLNNINAKSPSDRTSKEDINENETEEDDAEAQEIDEENDNPFSASPKI